VSVVLKRFEWFYQYLASKKLTLILFLLLCIFLIPRTFVKTTDYTLGLPGSIIFGVFGLNLILCTVRRIKALSVSVIVIHLGTLLTFAGVVISSFGYIATVNIYEGTSVDTVYRWDLKKDAPLGVDLKVKKINIEYYPIPLKVGVLRGQEKVGLFLLKTGERFKLDGYDVRADSLKLPDENLQLSVYKGDSLVGTADTVGARELPEDFPFDFRLVAYQNAHLMRVWVDLVISKGSEVLAEGASEVNSPLSWNNIRFHNTAVNADARGIPYAGIQINYDPGLPYVYAGFVVLAAGSIMYSLRLRRRYGRR